MDSEEKQNIYTKLRVVRERRGLTVDSLAKKIGENHQKVGRIERGARSLTLDYLVKVSKALDTPIESFLPKDLQDDKQEEGKQEGTTGQSASQILNEIVVYIEKMASSASAEQKGKLISMIYTQALRFPEKYQSLFISSLFESIKLINDLNG